MFRGMYNSFMCRAVLIALAIIVTACATKPDPNLQIEVAVMSTLAAIPIATSQPIPTPFP